LKEGVGDFLCLQPIKPTEKMQGSFRYISGAVRFIDRTADSVERKPLQV